MIRAFASAAASALLLAALPASAQRAPDGGPAMQRPSGVDPRIIGGVPGRFDYYAMVLSWSPTFCAENPRNSEDPQCGRRPDRPYAFVLHGLWPQYERGFPNSCPTQERPFVTERTINGILDIMPSRPLVIHEYRKHGVCSGLGPEAYFDFARKLHQKVKIPARFQSPGTNQMVDTAAVIGEFVSANPGLKPDMLAVSCGGPGNRLKDVRVCFSREGEFRACGGNENQRRMCGAPRVFVPPVRTGTAEAPRGPQSRGPAIVPRAPLLPGPPMAPGTRSL